MKLLCVGHAIKEVLTAGECLDALVNGAKMAGVSISAKFLISDGGDGFLDAYVNASPMSARHSVTCTGPLGDVIQAELVVDEDQKIAIIESARSSGLALVEPHRRNIMLSGTAGLADLIAAARNSGAKQILVGLGGTATCDGGIGLLWRLAELTGQCTRCDNEYPVALDMAELPAPDLKIIRDWLADTKITACVDVNNPLLGERGAARTFAPQKGATPEEVEQLEAFMEDWAQRVERCAGKHLREIPGSGAAGGLGFALAAIGAQLEPGGAALCRLTGLEDEITFDSVILTAEGRFDSTSFGGKAPWSVATAAREKQARAVIFCGVAEPAAADKARQLGVDIIEYGADFDASQIKQLTPDCLTEAVSSYLRTHSGTER